MNDILASSCRTMWADVLLAVMDDYNRDWQRPDMRHATICRARSYFASQDGRQVAAMAGIEVNIDAALAAIAMPRREWKLRASRIEEARAA